MFTNPQSARIMSVDGSGSPKRYARESNFNLEVQSQDVSKLLNCHSLRAGLTSTSKALRPDLGFGFYQCQERKTPSAIRDQLASISYSTRVAFLVMQARASILITDAKDTYANINLHHSISSQNGQLQHCILKEKDIGFRS